ncbi:MAG: aminoglycoside phosphotransferase family protein [Chromatiales bacterium]|jgi:Ser/Thr protein kinase RdoA (MazF antagonist)|nr:aminoglycoside phosphotransferase family protein [Chromatiales bacterium]
MEISSPLAADAAPVMAAAAFAFGGPVIEVRAHGRGLIHDTFVAHFGPPVAKAILQRINRRAFDRPELIMENLYTLLEHVDARGAGGLKFPVPYQTRAGEVLHTDADGQVWRAMSYIEHTCSYHRPAHVGHAREAGRVLGRFHALVHDLNPARMHDTRPDFHHTPRHLERLDAALAQADAGPCGDEVQRWLDFVAERRAGADAIEQALASGRIKRQIVHGDPKLDNVLFDERSDVAVALIDLDTVKPGTVHHDIGDCLRSCCNRAGETADDASAVRYDADMYRAALEGYFETAGDTTRDLHAQDVYQAMRLIPFELGARFLADHLAGDRYFRIDFPGQNLVRAATQFRLSADVERQREEIEEFVAGLIAKVG